MQKLIAINYILYLSKQYKPGDELPQNDVAMKNAWLEAGTAKLQNDESVEIIEGKQKKKAKAKPVTAPAGLTGKSVPKTSEDDLIGKLPKKK
ncbi:putative uncharacterized protein [Clostridium sp. CAG:411]|jgi:hypothetical protein|nr:putative uncharacterized protein [Clostridium sp. CAG:411]DAW23669.1 MAG TPA: hypothetical protein [Caudoviricetes sp.]